MPMPEEDDNALNNLRPYEDEESTSEVQDIEGDYRDLVGKSSNTGSRAKRGRTPQNGPLGNESSSFLKEFGFSE